MKQDLEKEIDMPFTPLLLIEEASRCLLCNEAPCSKACPAGTDPGRFIRAVRFKNFKGAVEIVRENNALAGICARICPTEKLCESACSRCGIDKPIQIGKIQRYITDYEEKIGMKVLRVTGTEKGNIAIVGSGPAGLEAAAKLRIMGYDIDVFEKREKLGGWLAYGIPEYRLPKDVLENEIKKIKDLGVNFKTKVNIGSDITLDELKNKYDAVLLATGLSEGRNLEIFENKPNVEVAVDFLARAKTGKIEVNENDVSVIVGGGDVAMDVASTLKLKNVKNVICVARETMEEFLASPKELGFARNLGVSILDGYTPTDFDGENITFTHTKFDSKLVLKADKVYLAVGQKASLSELGVDSQRNQIKVNNFQTSIPNVFAAGDVIEGDKLAVFAVKLGHEAAIRINEYLGGKKNV